MKQRKMRHVHPGNRVDTEKIDETLQTCIDDMKNNVMARERDTVLIQACVKLLEEMGRDWDGAAVGAILYKAYNFLLPHLQKKAGQR